MFFRLSTYRQPWITLAILCLVLAFVIFLLPWKPATWPGLPGLLVGVLFLTGGLCWIRSRPALPRARKLMELGGVVSSASCIVLFTEWTSDTAQALAALTMFTCLGVGGYLTWRSGLGDVRQPREETPMSTRNE